MDNDRQHNKEYIHHPAALPVIQLGIATVWTLCSACALRSRWSPDPPRNMLALTFRSLPTTVLA